MDLITTYFSFRKIRLGWASKRHVVFQFVPKNNTEMYQQLHVHGKIVQSYGVWKCPQHDHRHECFILNRE